MDVNIFAVKEKQVKQYNPLEYTNDQMHYRFTEQEQLSDDQLANKEQELLGELDTTQMEENPLTYEERVGKTKELAKVQSTEVTRMTKLFGNSDEMDAVQRMVSGLNALLEGEIPRLAGDNRIDIKTLNEKHLKTYEAALNACQHYLDVKNPKYGWTRRRYRKVENLKATLEKEKDALEIVVSNLADQKFSEEDLAGINNVRDLLSMVRSQKIEGEAEFQIEGNSTDVYRVKLKVNGKDEWYYFKQNLKPVGNDLPGFVKRRLRQLNFSSANKGNVMKEEDRLRGKIDQRDYDLGLEFLNKMDTDLTAKHDDIKGSKALNKRLLTFLGHDFDKMFKELDDYNTKANETSQQKMEYTARLNAAKANNARDMEAYYTRLLSELVVIKPMTEYEWLVNESKKKTGGLGLDLKKDADLFAILKRMSEEPDTELGGGAEGEEKRGRIARFFTRTLGKEIEAYGQIKERSEADDKEVMAKNNTATYRIANLYGFNDVITSSESAVLNFKLRGDEKSQDVSGTMSKEAPGQEMLKLVEIAEKKGKKIRYSPKALRQLTRLWMFDSSVLQTDRHWRNFKCMTTPDLRGWDGVSDFEGDIVIDSIGAYDHDMSYGIINYRDGFKKKGDGADECSVKNGMLPPVLRRIKSNSAEASYFKSLIVGAGDTAFYENLKMPMPREDCGYYKKTYEHNRERGLYGVQTLKDADLKAVGIENVEELPKRVLNGKTYYVYKNSLLEKSSIHNFILCDLEGKACNCDILEKMLGTEVKAALDMMKADPDDDSSSLTRMLSTSKFRHGGGMVDAGTVEEAGAYATIIEERLRDGTWYKGLDSLSEEDQVEVLYSALALSNIMDKIDPRGNAHEAKDREGFTEFHMRAVAYHLKLQLDQMPEAQKNKILLKVKDRVAKNNSAKLKVFMGQQGEAEGQAQGEEKQPEYIDVPTMMHMDLNAYNEIQNTYNEFDTKVRYALQDLGWDEVKIKAYKDRLKDMLEDIEKCRNMAEKILKNKYPANSPLQNFFLTEEQFSSIHDITELAWDPGMSYFATEDEEFLMSDQGYSRYLTDAEKSAKLEKTNKHRKIERMHGLKQDLTKYSTMIDSGVA